MNESAYIIVLQGPPGKDGVPGLPGAVGAKVLNYCKYFVLLCMTVKFLYDTLDLKIILIIIISAVHQLCV